jgi:membrane protease YdiL (CAAX protease family)
MVTASFALVADESGTTLAPEDVRDRVRALGLTADVEIEGERDRRLVLRSLESTDGVEERVHAVLAAAGYRALPFRSTRWPSAGPELLLDRPGLFLGAQSIVLLAFGLVFGALRVTPKPRLARAGLPRALLFGTAIGVLGFVASIGIGALQRALGLAIREQAWLVDLLSDESALLSLVPWLVLIAPWAEETFFRGYFFRFLDERVGPRIAYPLSAACFSLIHFHLPGLLVYFVVGLLFAWACRRTATLTAAIAAHVVYNGIALAAALLTLGS